MTHVLKQLLEKGFVPFHLSSTWEIPEGTLLGLTVLLVSVRWEGGRCGVVRRPIAAWCKSTVPTLGVVAEGWQPSSQHLLVPVPDPCWVNLFNEDIIMQGNLHNPAKPLIAGHSSACWRKLPRNVLLSFADH